MDKGYEFVDEALGVARAAAEDTEMFIEAKSLSESTHQHLQENHPMARLGPIILALFMLMRAILKVKKAALRKSKKQH